jgi:hypothetical protein
LLHSLALIFFLSYGRPSGQRDMIAALDQIVASYRLAGIYQLRLGDTPIRLYVRTWDNVAP